MGIIEELQKAKEKVQGNREENEKFLVNRRTYEALCGKGADRSMLIIADILEDGVCIMEKQTTGIYETALSVKPEAKKSEAEKSEAQKWRESLKRKRSSRGTKKKYRYKKRKK